MSAGPTTGRRAGKAAFRPAATALSFALLVLVGGCGEGGEGPGAAPRIGSPAPAYAARTLDGKELALADLRGEVVLLNIWATWCGPCVREMPRLEALHREFGARGVRVVGVNIDRGSAEETVRRYLARHGITFTILLDSDDAVSTRFRAMGVPETFLIDHEGIVRHRWIGEFDPTADDVRHRLETLLAGIGG
jgi:cytochrome c-type biogenesis protein